MSEIIITLKQLRGMIGQKVRFKGRQCHIVEVLEQSTELVLEELESSKQIQANQHGDAHRRVPVTIIVPVLSSDKTSLHPDFLLIDLI